MEITLRTIVGPLVVIAALAPTRAPAVGQLILPGIIHQWSADGNASDSIGDADGTIIAPVIFTDGLFHQAFDVLGGWVEFGSQFGNFGPSDFTVSLWVNTTIQVSSGLIEKRRTCNQSNFWEVRKFNASVLAAICDGGGGGGCPAQVYGTSSVNDGAWHHIAMRREGVTLFLFIDGLPEGTATSPGIIDINNSASIRAGQSGCIGVDGTMPYVGLIDEIQLYSRALSDAEIESLANDQPCLGDLNEDGTVGITDFLALLAFWGPCGAVCLGDLDGDGAVGIVDFLTLLGEWGPCQ